MNFYILPDNQGFYDPRGVYFDSEGFDEHGGYYDEEGKYFPGESKSKARRHHVDDDDELIRQFEGNDDDDYDPAEHDELQNKYYQEFKKKEKIYVETAALDKDEDEEEEEDPEGEEYGRQHDREEVIAIPKA